MPKSVMISIRIDPVLNDYLLSEADNQNMTLSEFCRTCIQTTVQDALLPRAMNAIDPDRDGCRRDG